MAKDELTHLDSQGRARMVDVGDKEVTHREAVAEGFVTMPAALMDKLLQGDLPKGDAIAVARIAGISGAKRAADLIPLCHPIGLTGVEVDITPDGHRMRITATVATRDRTGVEMEALTAVAAAALTLYDMVKGVERGVTIESVRLLRKSGGRSGEWVRPEVVD